MMFGSDLGINEMPENIASAGQEGRPQPLRIVSFRDGRTGHEKQTRGLLAALADLTPIEEEWRLVQPLSRSAQVMCRLGCLAARVRPRPACKEDAAGPDLIIGTGSATHIPMLLLKRKCAHARVVTCMAPDFLLQGQIDLCFVPRHDRPAKHENIFETIGPPCNVKFTDDHDRRKGLILVGGLDPRSHHWDAEAVLNQVRTLVQREPDCRWFISSSPRTPPESIRKLAEFSSTAGPVEFFTSQQTPAGWIEEQYRLNYTVWVTADSISMIYEALTAGCRVGILPVKWRRRNNKFQKSLEFLEANNYVSPYEKWLSDGYVSAGGVRLDEAGRCAREILRRWRPERLRLSRCCRS